MTGPADTAADPLCAWALERTRAGARVALLGLVPELSAALEAEGRTVLAVTPPPSEDAPSAGPWEVLTRFAPTHVVLLHAEGPLEAWLGVLRRSAPGAEILFGFWNAGCAARLLATLVGQQPGRAGHSDTEVARTLEAHGFQVRGRRAIGAPAGLSGLAAPTEAALSALLTQLNASAEADLLLYAVTAAEPPSAPAPPLVPGLLSVLVWTESPASPGLLDETLFSLACQEHHPLEVLLLQAPGTAPDPTWARHQTLGDFPLRRIEASGPDAWREALRLARGQYVAFLAAGGVVYPAHYPRLLQALREGASAWSMARAFRATCARGAPGQAPYIESKRPFPLGEHLERGHLVQEPELLQALVVDRTRVGPLCLEPTSGGLSLPVRLATLFEPVFLAEGLATCEVRSLTAEPPAHVPPAPGVQVLAPLAALEDGHARARAEGASARSMPVRLVEDLNTRLRERLPWLHDTLRALARRAR